MIEKDLWQKRLQPPFFSINENPISSWNMILALFILAAGFTLVSLYHRYIRRITHMFINITFIENDVINWTISDSRRRMCIPFDVAYGSDIKKVKSAILDALQKSSLQYICDETKQPMVVMTGMGSCSVDSELFVRVKGDETLKPLHTADKFLVLIYNAFYKNGIEIPYRQLDLHIRDTKDRLEKLKREE